MSDEAEALARGVAGVGSPGRRALAEAVRELVNALGTSEAPDAELAELAGWLRERGAGVRDRQRDAAAPARGANAFPGMEDFADRSPITGHGNPLAPPARFERDAEARVVRGAVTFGGAFEGAPGLVHGGFVAALLDEALGLAAVFSGRPAMTVELTTRYHRHTPVSVPLRLEARLVSVEGRRIRTEGELCQREERIAEASGLFIAVDAEKFARLAEARARRA